MWKNVVRNVGLYPSIPHQAGLSALKEALENRSVRKIPA